MWQSVQLSLLGTPRIFKGLAQPLCSSRMGSRTGRSPGPQSLCLLSSYAVLVDKRSPSVMPILEGKAFFLLSASTAIH